MRMSRRMGLLGGKKTALPTLAELFADMTVTAQNGLNSGSRSTVSVNGLDFDANPSIYIFAFCNNSFAIHHLLSNGSEYGKTTLYRATDDSNATNIYISGTSCYLSTDGSSSTKVYGGTIIAATFPSYTNNQTSAVFSGISVKVSDGVNDKETTRVRLSNNPPGEIILTAYNGAMCAAPVTSPTEYICTLDYKYSSSRTYIARNYIMNRNIYLSFNGTSAGSFNGGTILTI